MISSLTLMLQVFLLWRRARTISGMWSCSLTLRGRPVVRWTNSRQSQCLRAWGILTTTITAPATRRMLCYRSLLTPRHPCLALLTPSHPLSPLLTLVTLITLITLCYFSSPSSPLVTPRHPSSPLVTPHHPSSPLVTPLTSRHLSSPQVLSDAYYTYPYCERLYHRQEHSMLLLFHAGYNEERKNLSGWRNRAHSSIGGPLLQSLSYAFPKFELRL